MSDVPELLAAAVNRLPVPPHDELSGLSPISLAHMYLSQRQAKGQIQSKLFITSLAITEYSISDKKLLGTDLFRLKFPLYNRIFT